MTATWSDAPVERVVALTQLGSYGDNLGEHNGESRRVCLLPRYPGWLFKEYRTSVSSDGVQRLSRLIHFPQKMNIIDKALIDGHTAWPASQVVDTQQRTIGVMMPQAPENFRTTRQLPSGRIQNQTLEVDVLALSEQRQAQIKVPPQSLAERISICASFAAVGALFERHSLVYLDWSYANVFWSVTEHSAYVIDLDGCSFGPRLQIQSPGWEDPLVPRGRDAGNESDRYRIALLTARCLTGTRGDLNDTRNGLFSLQRKGGATGDVAGLLIRALNARTAESRPPILELSAALQAARQFGRRTGSGQPSSAGKGGVKEWKPLTPRPSSTPLPKLTIPSYPPSTNSPVAPPATSPRPRTSPVPTRTSPAPTRTPLRSSATQPLVPSPPSPRYGWLAVAIPLFILAIVFFVIIFTV
jgi:hypothetical protein